MKMNLNRNRPLRLESMNTQGTTHPEIEVARPKAGLKVLFIGLAAILMLQGCSTIGPKLYQGSFNDYNDAIRTTADEQMLSNLVRMRYLESPVFLQVSSVSTSFSLSGNVGASAALVPSAADNYGLSAGAGYSENPTITFSLPESRGYYGLLMSPLSAQQITHLIDAGWDSKSVLQTTLRKINGLSNISIETSTYPKKPKSYDDFSEVIKLITKLIDEGLVELAQTSGYAVRANPIGPIPSDTLAQAVLAAAEVYALSVGGDFIVNQQGNLEYQEYTFKMGLLFSADSGNSADAQRLKKLLQLNPEMYSFAIYDNRSTAIEKGRAYSREIPAAMDPNAIWGEIGLRDRSMLEIMHIAATAIEVPQEHRDITFEAPASAVSALVIKTSKKEPVNARVRTLYRGNWFYIEDTNLQSRAAYALITALFSVSAGTVPGAQPVLALPVGN